MAFDVQGVGNQGASFNVPFNAAVGLTGTIYTGTTRLMTYKSHGDAIATIVGSTYFFPYARSMQVNDLWFITGSDSSGAYSVSAIDYDADTVTMSPYYATEVIGTANIADLAVTNAKIANATITTGKISASAGIVGTQLASNTVLTANLDKGLVQTATGAITAAQWNGMYAAPFEILAATVAGAGQMIVVEDFFINYVYGSAAFAGGGATLLQYGTTVNGAGPAATATLAAASFSDQTANRIAKIGGVIAAAASAGHANTSICISNQTAAFTTGTGGAFTYRIRYHLAAVV